MVLALMHFQTSASILVPGTGGIQMSPQSTNRVVEERSRSEEYYSINAMRGRCSKWRNLDSPEEYLGM